MATIASKIFVFKVEILENAQSYPFSQIHSHNIIVTVILILPSTTQRECSYNMKKRAESAQQLAGDEYIQRDVIIL